MIIGLNLDNITPTYIKANKLVFRIVSDNTLLLKYKFNLGVNGINKKLPNLY